MSHYYGESARNGFDRGLEHLSPLKNESSTSNIVVHWKEYHQQKEWAYTMRVVADHKTPLPRQVHEGQLIGDFKGQRIINRKGEWGENLPPKLVHEDTRDEAQQQGESTGPQAIDDQNDKRNDQNWGQLQSLRPNRARRDGEPEGEIAKR